MKDKGVDENWTVLILAIREKEVDVSWLRVRRNKDKDGDCQSASHKAFAKREGSSDCNHQLVL